ncbi:MAG: condensation domain-containing protein, partial [Thermoanaerobaculia bacterium]
MTKPHHAIEDIYPLSPMQEGMLFHSLYGGEEDAPLLQWNCRFEKGIDAAAFRGAWERVIDRHAILRTAIVLEEAEEPVQVVFGSVPAPWRERDLSELSAADRARAIEDCLKRDRHARFELTEPPLMRFALLRLTEHSSLFVWTFHLLLLDGWSTALVWNEALALYESLRAGQAPALTSPRPYREYIAWQQRQGPARAERFWSEALAGVTAPTPLVVERTATGSTEEGAGYDEREIRLSAAATRSLQEFSRRHRLTLNTLMRAAWALLLHRYSGEPTVVFGATSSGRPAALPGVESMVGLFINTSPVRVDVPDEESVATWLKRLQ